ncbi:MAG: DNA polymerase III subunit delta [Defluviitaleaceae bacterium]|nr:DNA polymerase III subunit delta [Defluviitaleaceae bacterium]
MKELEKDIKTRKFRRIYLFYGEERFLTNHWQRLLLNACSDGEDFTTFEGNSANFENISEAAENMPFNYAFNGSLRVILIKDSGLFAAGRKADSDEIAKYIKDLPQWSVLIFNESSIDKRIGAYKSLSSLKDDGLVFEAKKQREPELIRWLIQIFTEFGKHISSSDAMYMIRKVSNDMGLLYSEAMKLSDYLGGSEEINTESIDLLCTKSTEAKIFDLLDTAMRRDSANAVFMYRELLAQKESPMMVLVMAARQFRYILQCGELSRNFSQKEIAQRLGLNPYAVRIFTELGRDFSQQSAIRGLKMCLETDCNIKSGQIADALGVEVLIAEICSL